MEDTRRRRKIEEVKVFNRIYKEFKEDNRGCLTILDFLEKEYEFEVDYWVKVARRAGIKVMKSKGVYFIKA